MVPENSMLWIAALLPLFSFIIGGFCAVWVRNNWVATILVFVGTFVALIRWFSMHFWPWLLLYLMLCWMGAWAGTSLRNWMGRER